MMQIAQVTTGLMRRLTAALLPWLLVIYSYGAESASQGYEVVTMDNGNIFHGTIAHETFVIETKYGLVTIPYSFVASLTPGKNGSADQITTHLGELFSGALQSNEFTILRFDQPLLPLEVADISDIQFSRKTIRSAPVIPADSIQLSSGDRFTTSISTSSLLIMADNGLSLISLRQIHLVDLEEIDGQLQIRITDNDGKIMQGKMGSSSLQVTTRYGDKIEIPSIQLSQIALNVHYGMESTLFHYRQKLNPATLFHDQLYQDVAAPEMIALRGGSFIRGSRTADGDSDELPLKPVQLKPFAIGLYEVTFEEYDLFCEVTGHEKPDDSGWGRGNRPVVNVSWNDATTYAEWLATKTRQPYRLPSDAEWEYAARGGTETLFWWGNQQPTIESNCDGCGSIWDGERTAPVGRFKPNLFGLHDTAGNVFEIVADCWSDSYADAPTDGSPYLKGGCGKRVIRGGAWSFPPHEVRSANRWRDFPSRKSDDTGFRVARDL